MNIPIRTVCFAAWLIFGMTWVASGVRAGAGVNDDHDHDEDAGPSYFGFVRDMRNAPVADAKVSVKIANGVSYVVRSSKVGLYRVRGLGKEISPNDVSISCAKDGYRQIRVVRRPLTRGKPVKAIETECRLQRE